MTTKLCVFCGSRLGSNPNFEKIAAEAGRLTAGLRWTLVYGGGNVGLMKSVADAALIAGGRVIGVIPKELLAREAGKRDIDTLEVTETMFDRKQRMIAISDAFLILPGGYGTLDELLEVVTLKQLGYHDKPIVLLNIQNFWQSCLLAFDNLAEVGFASPKIDDLLTVANSTEDAFDLMNEKLKSD